MNIESAVRGVTPALRAWPTYIGSETDAAIAADALVRKHFADLAFAGAGQPTVLAEHRRDIRLYVVVLRLGDANGCVDEVSAFIKLKEPAE